MTQINIFWLIIGMVIGAAITCIVYRESDR